jgi:hypothetical protein
VALLFFSHEMKLDLDFGRLVNWLWQLLACSFFEQVGNTWGGTKARTTWGIGAISIPSM